MNKPLYVNGLCLWLVREIEKIDVVGLHRFQSSLPGLLHLWRYCILKIWGIQVSFGCERSCSSPRRVSNFNIKEPQGGICENQEEILLF